jgi:hypothetical protein
LDEEKEKHLKDELDGLKKQKKLSSRIKTLFVENLKQIEGGTLDYAEGTEARITELTQKVNEMYGLLLRLAENGISFSGETAEEAIEAVEQEEYDDGADAAALLAQISEPRE